MGDYKKGTSKSFNDSEESMIKNGWNINCGSCGKKIYVVPSQLKRGRGKFCSMSCRSKVIVYKMHKSRGEAWRAKARLNISKLHSIVQKDETRHPRWKGDDVGYFGVHDWMTKYYGQPIGCEVCNLDDKNRKYNWANLSGDYKRKREDFKRMCVPCHRKYDYAKKT